MNDVSEHCPDWEEILRLRDTKRGEERYRAALSHRRACGSCRSRSVALDPTLLFQECAEMETSEDDVLQMQRLVHEGRRFADAQRRSAPSARQTSSSPRAALASISWWSTSRALLAVAAAVLLLTLPMTRSSEVPAPAMPAHVASAPLVEAVGPARIYQIPGEMNVVMVIGPSIDF